MTAEAPAYRTHLFSDLRGYTTLLEKAGNAAGAEMLSRYRAMVRAASVATAGLRSAPRAMPSTWSFCRPRMRSCAGWPWSTKPTQENEAQPECRSGSAWASTAAKRSSTDETFVGTAVNVAARVCAVAQPGEVLVTGTVRGIVHGSVAATFHSQRQEETQGPGRANRTVHGRSRRAAGTQSAALASTACTGAGGGGRRVGDRPGAATAFWPRRSCPKTTPGPTKVPTAGVGPLGLGTYQSDRFTPRIRFDVTDPGWSVFADTSDAVGLLYQVEPPGNIDIGRPGRVFLDPCASEGDSVPVGRTAADLFDAVGQAHT